jgi:hypothetical protein
MAIPEDRGGARSAAHRAREHLPRQHWPAGAAGFIRKREEKRAVDDAFQMLSIHANSAEVPVARFQAATSKRSSPNGC